MHSLTINNFHNNRPCPNSRSLLTYFENSVFLHPPRPAQLSPEFHQIIAKASSSTLNSTLKNCSVKSVPHPKNVFCIIFTRSSIHAQAYTKVHTSYTKVHKHTHTHTHTHTHIYIYIYIYAYTHTHTHTYIYINTMQLQAAVTLTE
jgi:hypothetical protein